jgi:hypothetical protein
MYITAITKPTLFSDLGLVTSIMIDILWIYSVSPEKLLDGALKWAIIFRPTFISLLFFY